MRQPALVDCACEVTVCQECSGIEIHYCPMHQAAKGLLEALTEILNETRRGKDADGYGAHVSHLRILRTAQLAIAKAGG